jgi:predicted HTH transcriptional regulator
MDLTGWLEYFVAGLSTQLQEVKARGEQAIRADVVAREHKLNTRQAALVEAFMREKHLTLAACELLLPETSRRTLQRDLRGLVASGLISEVGQATDPTRHYRWQEP